MKNVALLAALAALASGQVIKGFNYGSDTDFQTAFTTAQNLVGASGFTSARLYTMIEPNTADTPTSAIPAAINTKTTLLLGMWASSGQATISNEITALTSAISQYGSSFTDLIKGISVGSEDLYRISPTGIENESGVGAEPSDIVNYIGQVRSALSGAGVSSIPVGHVDTWTAWVNGSNDAVISACDFLGMDAYPYFQNTMANDISNGYSLFNSAYEATVGNSQGKSVWVTETGWPVSGATENQAVPSVQNAQTYWDQVGCGMLFDKIDTWWYVLILQCGGQSCCPPQLIFYFIYVPNLDTRLGTNSPAMLSESPPASLIPRLSTTLRAHLGPQVEVHLLQVPPRSLAHQPLNRHSLLARPLVAARE